MSTGAKKLAHLVAGEAKKHAKYHGGTGNTIGVVKDISPEVTILPLTGKVAIPDTALGWTLTATALKPSLVAGSQVLMVLVGSRYYVIDGIV